MQLKTLLRPAVFPFLPLRVRHTTSQRRSTEYSTKTQFDSRAIVSGKLRRAAA
jgi:hypothetical protein